MKIHKAKPKHKSEITSSKTLLRIFCLILSIFFILLSTGQSNSLSIDIISKNLSPRILLLDNVETRLKLIIGFTITGDLPSDPAGISALGTLSYNNAIIASFTMSRLDYMGGNLVFYLPYDIRPGDYDMTLELIDIDTGQVISVATFAIENLETLTARDTGKRINWMSALHIPLQNPPDETLRVPVTEEDRKRGYIRWHRNPFRYVYPNSAPVSKTEVIHSLELTLAQNEYEPLTFSLYGLRDIGKVSIDFVDASNQKANIFKDIKIHIVETVPRIKDRKYPQKGYEMRPRLLVEKNFFPLTAGRSSRLWLQVHADADTLPGIYRGAIKITTTNGVDSIPLQIEVLPFALMARPDKQYGFMMTYEFQEMTAQDLTEQERALVFQNGLAYYRSFKEHGITTVIPHSPFVFKRLATGDPDLRDLDAALAAYLKVGFTGPFIYYCGHLVQSAKPGWAGSTLGYDERFHPQLMQEIVRYTRQHVAEFNRVDFYWMPGDEVQHDAGMPIRMRIANQLLRAIKDLHGKTAITVWGKMAAQVDIKFGDPRPRKGQHWQYPNEETTVPRIVDDAQSMRRVFGLGHLKSNYVGIAPWTFQTSENANGNPYTDLDGIARPEVMVAYPGIGGPISTPEYEAVREGIDDGRYAYKLETLLDKAAESGNPAIKHLGLQGAIAYKLMLNRIDHASLEEMDQNREKMKKWIMRLQAQMSK